MFTNTFEEHLKKKLFSITILILLIQIVFIYKIEINPISGLFFF